MIRRPRSTLRVLAILLALSAVVLVAGVAIGPVTIPLGETVSGLFGRTASDGTRSGIALIIHSVRLPRVILGFLVGGALAVSGAVMQGLFRNPLGSPYILGVASGASAGAAVSILAGWPAMPWLSICAFLGGLAATGIVYGLARGRDRRTSIFTLILAGVAVGALFSAVTSLVIFLSSRGEKLADVVFWIMGSLGRTGWGGLAILAPVFVLGTVIVMSLARDLDALSLGEQGAFHLGVDPQRTARLLLVLSTLLASAAVAMAGTIGFVGLIVPHALRLILGPNHRTLIPASALGGGLFLVLADIGARTLMRPVEIPVGILTAFLGAPFFLYLLRTQGRRLP
jgi:iron complex transport system permease protein